MQNKKICKNLIEILLYNKEISIHNSHCCLKIALFVYWYNKVMCINCCLCFGVYQYPSLLFCQQSIIYAAFSRSFHLAPSLIPTTSHLLNKSVNGTLIYCAVSCSFYPSLTSTIDKINNLGAAVFYLKGNYSSKEPIKLNVFGILCYEFHYVI